MTDLFKWLRGRLAGSRLSKNTMPKLFALLFAVIFWLYVMDQVNPVMTISVDNVPVNLINVEDVERRGLVIMDNKDFFVDLRVQGRRNDLYTVSPDDFSLVADLRGYEKGTHTVPIEATSNREMVEIASRSVSEIKIFLDRMISESKPVEVYTSGDLSEGYRIGSTQLDPEAITVTGPETIVNQVRRISGTVQVTGKTLGISEPVAVMPRDADGEVVSGVTLSANSVRVQIPVNKEKEVPVRVDLVGEVPEGYRLTDVIVRPERVVVSGLETSVDGLNEVLTVPVDLTDLTASFSEEISFNLPERIRTPYLETTPEIELRIEPVEAITYDFRYEDITIDNRPPGLEIAYGATERYLSITVEDVPSVLETIEAGDFEPFVDASRVTEAGVHELKVYLRETPTAERIAFEPATIALNFVDPTASEEEEGEAVE